MAGTDIQITVQSGQVDPHSGTHRFEPEDIVRGQVQVLAGEELRCQHLWVRLQWHTEGRGDRDEGTADSVDVFQGTLTPGAVLEFDFELLLPREPWSFVGHYIHIIWEVVAEIAVPLSPDVRARQRFILAPRNWEPVAAARP